MDEAYLQKHVLAHYTTLPATEFGLEHVRAILTPIAKETPHKAEKVRGVLGGMFNVAIRGGRKMGNINGSTWLPPTHANPVEPVVLPRRETESFVPSVKQLETVVRAAADESDAEQAILLQAQTCARVTEVAAMPRASLDLDAGIWTLPAARSKNSQAHRVMLSDPSLALLRNRQYTTIVTMSSPAQRAPCT